MNRLLLQSREHLALLPSAPLAPREGELVLTVLCCAICRSDAKMWRHGHRDLLLPRVLGHEIVGLDQESGRLYAVWPGEGCGRCRHCLAGREHRCPAMRIIGFHRDGGLAGELLVPRRALTPLPAGLDPQLATFAEPVACVANAFSRLGPVAGQQALVVGGGVMGMLAALILVERGCQVSVLELQAAKVTRLQPLAEQAGFTLCQESTAADFDLAINCSANPAALAGAIGRLERGGRLAFFSGLEKNQQIDSNILNLVHYYELAVTGSYGPRREDMAEALAFCHRQQGLLPALVEEVVTLAEVADRLPRVLSGENLKYIVDFRPARGDVPLPAAKPEPASMPRKQAPGEVAPGEEAPGEEAPGEQAAALGLSPFLASLVAGIRRPDAEMRGRAQAKVDNKTKPLGALGRLEKLAVRLAVVTGSLEPRVDCRRLFVFAGDHGVVEEGVSAFPARVTVQMVENFLAGGAAINLFCRHYGIELAVVDIGVNGDFADHPLLRRLKVARGTANFALEAAMSRAQALTAMENGARAFLDAQAGGRCQLVGMGEMGIGNTTSATAIIAAVSGRPVAELVGRGTGVDDAGLRRKVAVIERALSLHRPPADDPLALLCSLGGYELAGICGATLAAAASGCPVVLDGIISTAAGLLAFLFAPALVDSLIAGHRSVERGQEAALQILGLEPVVDLDLRLGEGTGAAITMNLADLACRMLAEMASFDQAGVDDGGRSH